MTPRFLFCLCLLLAGCSRAPQTAAELRDSLPRQFRGDIHLQGETNSRKIVVEPHEFMVRTEHMLEFNRVRYQLIVGSEVLADGEAAIRGTISAPGLNILIEEADVEGTEAIKKGTFQGHLDSDLQSMEASWTTGAGQGVTLKAKAVK